MKRIPIGLVALPLVAVLSGPSHAIVILNLETLRIQSSVTTQDPPLASQVNKQFSGSGDTQSISAVMPTYALPANYNYSFKYEGASTFNYYSAALAGSNSISFKYSNVSDAKGNAFIVSPSTYTLSFTVAGQSEQVSANILSGGKSIQQGSGPAQVNSGWQFALSGGATTTSLGSGSGSVSTVTLQPGTYSLVSSGMGNMFPICNVASNPQCTVHTDFNVDAVLSFANIAVADGCSAAYPVMPSGARTASGGYTFPPLRSGQWFDPVVATGYDFTTVTATSITKIMGLPTGFSAPFQIMVEGTSLGTFVGGSVVDFVALTGHSVSSFSIRGIDPGTDPNAPSVFPIALEFDTETANVDMTPAALVGAVPDREPSALMACGVLVIATRVRRASPSASLPVH